MNATHGHRGILALVAESRGPQEIAIDIRVYGYYKYAAPYPQTLNEGVRTMRKTLLVVCFLLTALVPLAKADATYLYVGNPYTSFNCGSADCGGYTTQNFLTIIFTLPSPLAPDQDLLNVTTETLNFGIFDGVHSASSNAGDTLGINISTDNLGNVVGWIISSPAGSETTPYVELFSFNSPASGTPDDGSADPNGFNYGRSFAPGTWKIFSAAEPSTLLLSLIGIGLITVVRRGA